MPDFIAVKTAERVEIKEARRRRRALFSDPNELLPEPADTTGVAFSGGGIRSATFNLGILQGLARYNLVQRVDYISTVSGGGYIGSWLISWIRRGGLEATITGLSSSPPTPPVIPGPPAAVMAPAVPPTPPQRTYVEAKAINFLRAYSNYLTPRLGVLIKRRCSGSSCLVCSQFTLESHNPHPVPGELIRWQPNDRIRETRCDGETTDDFLGTSAEGDLIS